jgi:hypothetical protein
MWVDVMAEGYERHETLRVRGTELSVEP